MCDQVPVLSWREQPNSSQATGVKRAPSVSAGLWSADSDSSLTHVFCQEKKSQNKFQHPESSVIGFLEQASRQHSPTLSARKIMSRCMAAPVVFQKLLSCKKSFQKSFQNPGGRKGRSKDEIFSNTRAYSPALPHCNFSMSKITSTGSAKNLNALPLPSILLRLFLLKICI